MTARPDEHIPLGETITDIRPLPSDPNLRSVRVGRRTIARLGADDLEAMGIEVGQELTGEVWDALDRAGQWHKARKAALGLLGRRSYSTGEIVQRLARRGFSPELRREVAEQLAADGWIDDEAYAKAVARQIQSRGPAGKRLIVSRLRQRKIGREIAEHVAEEAVADVDHVEEGLILARRRLHAMGTVPPGTAARRIGGLLARRGLDADTVRSVIDRLRLFDGGDEDL